MNTPHSVELERYFRPRNEETYPIRRSEKIEPGGIYRARNGERVRVYTIEGSEIHGALFHNNKWNIDTWNLDGKYLDDLGKTHPRDIVITPPIQIIIMHKYKSRDGRPVMVYAVNKGSIDFPVVGAILCEKNYWLPRVWNDKGITKTPFGPNNDIVAEWSET